MTKDLRACTISKRVGSGYPTVLHNAHHMVNGAWCDLTLTLWSLAVCSVFSYVEYKLCYANLPSGSVKQVTWLWDDTEQPFRVIFVSSHIGFRKSGWVSKVSESEWDFCPSGWENLLESIEGLARYELIHCYFYFQHQERFSLATDQ